MKALILDKDKNNEVVVLREDGEILTVDCQGMIGETIELEKQKNIKDEMVEYIKEIMFACVCFAIVLIATASYNFYCRSPYIYVSLDINPSVEYTLNRQGKVIEVSALNIDGKRVLKKYNTVCKKYCDFDKAIDTTTDILYKENYIKKTNNYILMNISSDNKSTISSLENHIEELIKKKGDKSLNLYFTESNKKVHEKATKLGISTGRYVMMEDIYKDESDDDGEIPSEEEKVKVCQNDSVFSLLSSTGRISSDKDKQSDSTYSDEKKEKIDDFSKEKEYNRSTKDDKEICYQEKVDKQENEMDFETLNQKNNDSKVNKEFTDKNGKSLKYNSKGLVKSNGSKSKDTATIDETTDPTKQAQSKENSKSNNKTEEDER
ncbi:hypothetical protein [Lachnobacterium bovis]|uniref:Anti-sigma factor RsgI-like middle domain-containing protein n=1 Tax=Lachnobacterium bovis TaxID=140626 RepID=A0A1H9THB3_9FIRM|nr:hypothetical protein [Lachnobacterium bovis]SER96720.1 hypothetical protein SAMN02910429_01640 [Lachnobacterium bovis]